jgi:membrane associated rhomboid family serine protease
MQRGYRVVGNPLHYLSPAVKWLLIVNAAVFAIQQFIPGMVGLFGLTPVLVRDYGFVWQLFTYMFLHGGIWHLVINMLMLWMFGTDLERDWGTRRFLRYYFLCGVGAGVSVVVVALALASARPADLMIPTIGASGAIFGLLLAFGVVYADRIILMMLLFPMKAKYAVMIFGVIEFYYVWRPAGGVSSVAHLGGMLFGYLYLKVRVKPGNPLRQLHGLWREWRMERARRRFQVYLRKRGSDRDRWVN